jgi:acetolactate synthase I/II/III large subunit
MERSGAEIIIEELIGHGIEVVAGMPGGANLPLYDALARSSLRHVLVRHEQAAGFIAQGMARVSGRAGVCFATSGPGATNLVTALADARMDSIPLVAITGQVPTALIGTDAFQEVDTCAIVRPVVKHAERVDRVHALAPALRRAFQLAQSGRPGPVLLDVPKDVQTARCAHQTSARAHEQAAARPSASPLPDEQLDAVVAELERARRPVLFIGGGVVHAGAQLALAELAARQQLPVACSLMGLGCFDPDAPLALGMIGMHAAPFTNLVLHEADLIIGIGVRFDDRATGKLSEFCPHARTVHVDIDARELGKLRALELAVCCDAARFLAALLPRVPARRRPEWSARVSTLKRQEPLVLPAGRDPRRATHLLQHVAQRLDPRTIVTTDVGQHQMWAAQLLPFRSPRRLLTSGGLGSMGFGLPAAIGAALASDAQVLCISGDGSLLLNIHELATLAEHELDVTILLLDNRHLGLVRQQQALFYGARFSAAHLPQATDFPAVARAMGVRACSLGELPKGADPFERLDELLAGRGPQLIHAPIEAGDHVLPMVPPGAANHEMVRAQPL